MKKIILFISCMASVIMIRAQSPAFLWTKNFGGSAANKVYSMALDASGNVFTVGMFGGTGDFDPGAGTFNMTGSGYMFLSKLDASGNFLWAKQIDLATARSITTDAFGNVYIIGWFPGTVDFDPGPGTVNLTPVHYDILILKLDAAGNFVWVKQISGTSLEYGYSIATDKLGNLHTTGYFSETTDFDPGPGMYQLTSAGFYDIFVLKLDASGNFLWAKQMGGENGDFGESLALDAAGNVYTTGYFEDTVDFNPGGGIYNLIADGIDIFVSKLDASGNFLWAKKIGGTEYDLGFSITADALGNVYTTGSFIGTADFDPGPGIFNLFSQGGGGSNMFISKLDASGNFLWANNIAGTQNYLAGQSIATDAPGNVYTTGQFYGMVDFDPGPGTFNLFAPNNSDIYISKSDASGNFLWAKQMGGTLDDQGNLIELDPSGNIYTAGRFSGTADFDPGSATFNLTSNSSEDIFINKLSQCNPPSAMITANGPTTFCSGGSVVLTAPVAANRSYQWKKGGNLISGATLSSYTATTGGNYRVIVTNTITGCSRTTGSATVVTVNAKPAATITPQGPTTFCAGGSVVLAANTGTGLTYKWKKGGNYISGATLLNYTATTAGTYRVEVTNSNGCSKLSAGITITVPCREGVPIAIGIDINVFPNPSSGDFVFEIENISEEKISIHVYDVMGKLVLSESIHNSAFIIHHSKLVPGIYSAEIKCGNNREVTKIIKTN